ncbi:MAG: ABC transporter substrate-binding protein [Deltaproteobacteria bacterium]|nr:ABC transporter substrate-binding protein [Deltaproteobacteria bacterium]
MSSRIRLSVAVGDYEIIRALKDGAVEADGLDLVVLSGHGPRERHWRMARNHEFDVCEFNVGAYLMSRDHHDPIAAIPVFLHRRFRHGFAFINVNSGIKTPKDLIGARVGGTNFQPAGNIWLRGILEERYGVPHKEITWVVDRKEDVEFAPPPGLRIETIPPGKSMDSMLAEGEIPAMINPYIPEPIANNDPRVARLFPDYQSVEREYFQQTGIFPIMHVTVIKQEIVEKHPWVAASLVKAFEKAKNLAYKRVANPRITPLAWVRTLFEEERKLLGPDPWVYGLGESNRKNLETVICYCHQQGLISRSMSIEELFIDTDPEDGGDVDHV